jgi:hypothetical protein
MDPLNETLISEIRGYNSDKLAGALLGAAHLFANGHIDPRTYSFYLFACGSRAAALASEGGMNADLKAMASSAILSSCVQSLTILGVNREDFKSE